MSGYPSVEPRAPGKRSGVTGCLVGCLVAAAAVVAILLAAGLFVGWRLTRPAPQAAAVGLRDGTESLFVHARLEPDDPGLNALVASAASAARDLVRSQPGAPPMLDVPRARARFEGLPLEIDVVRRAREDGTEGLVGSILFEGRPRMARAVFRIVAFLAPTDGTEGLRKVDRDGRTTLVLEKTVATPASPELALTMVGDRLVGARDLATLDAALGAATPPENEDEPSALAGEVRLDGETGWGYSRPRGAAAPEAVRLAVFSFKLAGEDLVRWRAALRSESAPQDKEASAQALVASVAGISLPGSMKITLDRTTRWLDDKTLVVEGTIDGIGGAVREIFRTRETEIRNEPEAEPGTEPASPSP